ncbi:MAG TPA: hypothetical protein VGG07_09815 [Solirubrobacteraceae bacterium]|jgi:hypothetical protein
MRFFARLAVCAATLSGLICAAVSTVSPQALAASAASCRTGPGGLPFLLTAGGHGARVSGSVLALTPGTTVTIASSGGGGARAASNGVHPGQALLRFCVQPARLARGSTLLTMAPSGVSVVVTHGRALALSHAAGGHVRVTGAAALRGRAQLVEVVLDRRRQRASLLVDGGRRASLPATIPATTRISIGTAGRPSGSGVVAVPAGAVPSATTTAPTTSPAAPAGAPTTVPSGTGSAATTPALTTPPAPPHGTPSAPATTAAPPASTETATTTPGPPILPPPGDTTTTQGVAQAANVPYNPFSPTSFWNAPTAPLDAVDPQSQTYVDDLLSQINSFGVYMNTTSYSAPVYVVPGDQPTVPVALTVSAPDLQQEFNAVPIPPGAKPAAGSDAHLTVWQPSTDKLWEFWKLGQTSRGGWTARWGGEMDDVSTNPGYFDHDGITNDWGATATSLPLLGGLITFADLKRGYIDHALAIAVPEAEEGVFSWPAQRSDGRYTGGVALPEGIRFRLDPTINVASLGLPRLDAMLAQAAQTYGIVLRDQSGAVTLYAQDPTTAGANPWPAALNGGGVSTGTFLSQFPWIHLQAIHTQLTTTP